MALPTSRNTTYTPAAPVKSADLNAIQDNLISAYGDVHGDRTLVLPGIPNFTNQCAWDLGNGWVASSGAPWTALYNLFLPIGKRIKSLAIQRYGTGGSSMNLILRKVTPGATAPVSVQTLAIAAPPASWNDSLLTLATPEEVQANEYFMFEVNGAIAAQQFKCLRVVVDQITPTGN